MSSLYFIGQGAKALSSADQDILASFRKSFLPSVQSLLIDLTYKEKMNKVHMQVSKKKTSKKS